MYIIFSINLTNACLAPNLVLQEACPGSCRGERKEERPCTKSASTAAAGRARCWRAASSPPPLGSEASSSSPCPLSVSGAAGRRAGGTLPPALVLEGKFVVAVPSFGFERRGAPVASYLRFDEREIRQMTNIYHPDCVLCIDPTVPRAVNVFEGIKDGAVLVQTTAKPLGDFELPREVATVGLCDAVSIALDIFKRSIP